MKKILISLYKKWYCLAFVISALTLVSCGGKSNEDIAREAIGLIEEEEKKDGNNLEISELPLIKTNGNTYTGIATGIEDGVRVKYNVTVHYDGENIMAEWQLIEAEDIEDYDDDDNVSLDNESVAKKGYNAGYEEGFAMGNDDYFDDEDIVDDARIEFEAIYGAPKSSQQKQLYQIFLENYKKGYKDRQKAS